MVSQHSVKPSNNTAIEASVRLVVTHSDGIPALVPEVAVYEKDRETVYLSDEFYTPFLSKEAKEMRPSPIRSLHVLESRPNLISLLAGQPNPDSFPFTSISFTARSPVNPSTQDSFTITGQTLSAALQYSPGCGIPSLVDWVTGLQEYSHGRKRSKEWRVTIGGGSQDVIFKTIHTLVDDGDPVLIESPVYAGVIPIFQSLHCEFIEIETDADGLSGVSLQSILDEWPVDKRRPRILYTVPYGSNPSGTTTALQRRLEILKIARENNILILEDDPYYYLYFGSRPRPPSYFALEAQNGGPAGIVLRFDSLSKILSAGMRIGAVSGPAELLRFIDSHTSNSNLQPSSLTQAMAYSLLSGWGYDGFRKHTDAVSELYRVKRDAFEKAMQKHLGGLADWVTPEAGMFFWFKLHLPPSEDGQDGDSETLIRTRALENGVLALPGTVFLPNGTRTAYVRAAFSLLNEEHANEALKRLGHVVRQAQGLTNGKENTLSQ